MNNFSKKLFFYVTLFIAIGFTSCEDASADLTLSNEEILESGEWLLKGFETNVMHTYKDGKQFTYYGENSVFSDEAIPGTQDFSIDGDMITLDYNFGNISTYEIRVSCDNNIIEFFKDGELNTTLYQRNSDYKSCL